MKEVHVTFLFKKLYKTKYDTIISSLLRLLTVARNHSSNKKFHNLARLDLSLSPERKMKLPKVKKLLNQLGGYILRDAGFISEKCQDYDWIKKETEYAGFAEFFLSECDRSDNDADSDADAASYQTLVDIDVVLGTDASLQLFRCINKTTRSDMIKV